MGGRHGRGCLCASGEKAMGGIEKRLKYSHTGKKRVRGFAAERKGLGETLKGQKKQVGSVKKTVGGGGRETLNHSGHEKEKLRDNSRLNKSHLECIL